MFKFFKKKPKPITAKANICKAIKIESKAELTNIYLRQRNKTWVFILKYIATVAYYCPPMIGSSVNTSGYSSGVMYVGRIKNLDLESGELEVLNLLVDIKRRGMAYPLCLVRKDGLLLPARFAFLEKESKQNGKISLTFGFYDISNEDS